MSITLTVQAADRVRKFLPDAHALRFGIQPSGCSGNSYVVQPADGAGPEDEVFESRGITIVVDRKNLTLLDGTEIDYRRVGLNEGFQFNNPNEKARCGCGESFTA
jgi:iron-sulfur cluster assembly protein